MIRPAASNNTRASSGKSLSNFRTSATVGESDRWRIIRDEGAEGADGVELMVGLVPGTGNEERVAMPLREMMRGFFDELKSLTSGYASITYRISGLRPASVTRLDIVIADEVIPAFVRVISRRRAQEEADEATEKLQSILRHHSLH